MDSVKDMLTVSEVSRLYGVSARMLRHYEKTGLMDSGRKKYSASGMRYRGILPGQYSSSAKERGCTGTFFFFRGVIA